MKPTIDPCVKMLVTDIIGDDERTWKPLEEVEGIDPMLRPPRFFISWPFPRYALCMMVQMTLFEANYRRFRGSLGQVKQSILITLNVVCESHP